MTARPGAPRGPPGGAAASGSSDGVLLRFHARARGARLHPPVHRRRAALMRWPRQGRVTAYIGFDCTADSLHVGSLVQIMMLRWLQTTGHKPIVLLGGGTTKIGDPSGRDESRALLTEDAIATNKRGIRRSFDRFLTFGDGASDALLVDNADWLDTLGYIPALARRGRSLFDQPDADLRQRAAPSRPRATADLPGVQLHDPPGPTTSSSFPGVPTASCRWAAPTSGATS